MFAIVRDLLVRRIDYSPLFARRCCQSSALLSVLLLGCCQRGPFGATLTTHPLAGTPLGCVALGPTETLTWDM